METAIWEITQHRESAGIKSRSDHLDYLADMVGEDMKSLSPQFTLVSNWLMTLFIQMYLEMSYCVHIKILNKSYWVYNFGKHWAAGMKSKLTPAPVTW